MNEQSKILSTTYDPKGFEEKLLKKWEEGKYFTPDTDPSKEPYSIIMPPPNITGKLHMGHALDNTLQDIIIRFKRMQGYNALWLPGQDHASIATEVKVENELLSRGIKKKEIGREKFLEHTWAWANEYRGKIREQISKLGCSCDYSREAFTMDDNVSRAVRQVFVTLYNEGLIYRGNRIINWCPKCMTAISDSEIEYEETNGHFWHIKYPFVDGNGYLEIATTRPETMLGDTAVAVNPNDDRFKHLEGKMLVLPLTGRQIPIVLDDYVDMDFGTGCVKITPAHDPNDYFVGKRHDLEELNIMNENGTINEAGGKYAGLDRYEARAQIVKDLEDLGYLAGIKEITHNVSTHDRCSTVIEPRLSEQWFVKMKPLAEPAIEAVKSKEIKFVPERFEKTYYNWMENIQDWCISRQLWWGHQIPVWYCDECHAVISSVDTPDVCPTCGSTRLRQDNDVLDTWFSSALWPFSTLGWPDETEDFKYFYPTSTLVTGYDIIFLWVARMIFSGIHNTGKIPFKSVLYHGIVRDELGRKMSKSLSNGVDPLDVIDNYGADALRFMLSTGNSPGNDIRYNDDKVESARNFANKIWNASRFAMMNLDAELIEKYRDSEDYSLADKWILSLNNQVIKEVTENFENFDIGIALTKVYDYLWTKVCDWYIELIKIDLYGTDEKAKAISQRVLLKVLVDGLKLLHPVMPFITEEIFTHLTDEETITLSKWPVAEEKYDFSSSEKDMDHIIEAIKSIRNIRQEMNIHPSKKAMTYILPTKEAENAFRISEKYMGKLGFASGIEIVDDKSDIANAVSIVTSGGEILLPLGQLIDKEKELERLNKEISKLNIEVSRLESKLNNEKFISKAPEKVVLEEKEKLSKYSEMLEKVIATLEQTKNL